METTAIERIRMIIDNEKLSVEAFSAITEVSKNTLDSMFKKKTNPSFENLNKILGAYTSYSSDWLLTGKGEMFRSSNNGQEAYFTNNSGVKYVELPNGKYRIRVPFIPAKAYNKYIENHKDTSFINELEQIEFIVDKIGTGHYFAFEIKGDSMDNDTKRSISDKDIVLTHELERSNWRDKVRNNDFPFWIIILDNAIVCKQIIHENLEKAEITCHSLNPSPEYADFKLCLSGVHKLFNIVVKQSSQF